MNNKTVEINNFIGVYDNYITPEECNKVIKVYEDETKLQKTLNRMASENASVLQKKDKQYFAAGHNLDVWWEDLKTLMFNVDIAFRNYCTNTGAHEAYNNIPFHYTGVKIQKTLPIRQIKKQENTNNILVINPSECSIPFLTSSIPQHQLNIRRIHQLNNR